MTASSAELRVVLYADETIVDESDDVALWQAVLKQIRGLDGGVFQESVGNNEIEKNGSSVADEGDSVSKFARDVGVSVEQLVGALGPQPDAPYLNLDTRKWESFVKNTPKRGTGSVPALVLAATALVGWAQHERSFEPTQKLAIDVLNQIGAKYSNPARSLKNCAWLQIRNGKIILNPAEKTQAMRILTAFVLGESVIA
ncbi:hypothetical protein GTQ45_11160 [Pyruvatibacter mobilis]|uniref:Uncharacterized protein n=1 Tax=Pyruvatibacter mobilis TaxID=1712261 RepID=A0A845QCI7_9HYPH|nr:hypothetical protein [Pyruvatibacter mobilis]NBG96292.1 hypothetical protein [Pyruvatibacter mobilis]QJD75786.1 hypothetical protein HG718_10420 [Pyruvatibacter mobilis]GGD18576.1 hypothetical protein GCM10011587_23690 [Pyruvatibacter mobilis]